MAASVDSRQFSSVRGCTFPPLLNTIPSSSSSNIKAVQDQLGPSSDDDDDEPVVDWKSLCNGHLEVEPSTHDPRDEATADSWIERNPSLIRLTGKHPFNCEPPLPRLMHHGFITPAPLHYVRNHGAVPRAPAPDAWASWAVDISGLVRRPLRLTVEQLASGFPAVEIPVTLVCAGNRRKEQNMVRQTIGFNWGSAGVSTSVWRGARLVDVLRHCKIMGRKDGALNVWFEGAEDLPGGGGSKYGTSVRREVAMDPARDIMIAYMQNGEPLLPDHGFPVRMIVPGFIGGRMVKWLKRIVVAPQESDNYYHARDNRVLPGHVDAELANAEAWWYKPEYIINELNINSVITTPGHDEILPINSSTTQRPYAMKGYAYSGISRSVKGYCMISVIETMKTYALEDGLTEEAIVTKLRTCRYHHLFLHTSLRHNSSGTSRWGEFGEGGLLWSECNGKTFEWFDGIPIEELLFKVREIYGLNEEAAFRNVSISSERRPQPLYLGTATQIGVIPTEGIPSLLKVLLPSNCTGLPALYLRDLLLNPPSYAVASAIQRACRSMSTLTCSIPEFTCVSAAKLVRLLESREANHIEFCRIKNVADEILQMHRNSELSAILHILLEPAWVSTGLKVEYEMLVTECGWISQRIGEIISLGGETDQEISSPEYIPREFFEDMESSWRGRVKRIHAEDVFAEVERAAQSLSIAVMEDFIPIVSRVKSIMSTLGGPKGEVCYAREHEAVWFKGKRFMPSVWANTPGEEQIKQLRPAIDAKGRKVGEEWFTTNNVDNALTRYHEANEMAKVKVLELLRGLSAEMQVKINVLVFSSMLLVIAKSLFAHVSEGRRREWVFPELYKIPKCKNESSAQMAETLELTGLSPYWFDVAQGGAVQNTVRMESTFLLTGPNGGGKSSLLRSICAAALLGICGLMVPAESATIPHFDSIMLHMKAYDSPADGKSSFQIEMSEIRSLVSGATSKSLVLVDEICRGTETAKGTCIAGSIVETLDQIGCMGIVSTHLHGIFDLPLATKNTVHKAMLTEVIDGKIRPTWKLTDGVCRESLAFETALGEGIPERIIRRAEELYLSMNMKAIRSKDLDSKSDLKVFDEDYSLRTIGGSTFESMQLFQKEVERAVTIICQKKLIELYKKKNMLELVEVTCVPIGVREQPPPSTVGASSIYILFRPDKKLYVGQTDDLSGRIRAHRSKEGMKSALFLYILVPGKSVAGQLETLLINQLPLQGFRLANKADGKHRNFGTTSNLTLESLSLRQ